MRIPKLCHHKPSGRAYVRVNRKLRYLGAWGDPDTEAAYNRFVVEHLAGQESAIPKPKAKGLTLRQLAIIYIEFAEGYYSASEMPGVRAMTNRVNEVAGDIVAAHFSPRIFKRVRDAMIAAENSRGYINQQHNRIVAMLAHGVELELIGPNVPAAIREVRKLKYGRSGAKETVRVTPAPDEDILAALEMMGDDLAVMVQLQLLSGCRPGELWVMRPGDIDRSVDPWQYRPQTHKNAWRGKERTIPLGSHAQGLLAPYLLQAADRLCFVTLSGEPWNRYRYRDSVHQACKRAGVPCFNPYQLRHNAGTETRRIFGLDAVQSQLGHSTRAMSERYAEDRRFLCRVLPAFG
jgi:integrase